MNMCPCSQSICHRVALPKYMRMCIGRSRRRHKIHITIWSKSQRHLREEIIWIEICESVSIQRGNILRSEHKEEPTLQTAKSSARILEPTPINSLRERTVTTHVTHYPTYSRITRVTSRTPIDIKFKRPGWRPKPSDNVNLMDPMKRNQNTQRSHCMEKTQPMLGFDDRSRMSKSQIRDDLKLHSFPRNG